MSQQHGSYNDQHLVVSFDLVPEEMDEADLANTTMVEVIKQTTVDALRQDGYLVQFDSAGRRDANVLINIIVDLAHLVTSIWQNKEIYEQVLNDASALITVSGLIVSITQHMTQAHKQRIDKQNEVRQPIKITLEIDGASFSIEAANLADTEAALKLAHDFYAKYPTIATKMNSHSKVKILGIFPKKIF